MWTSEQIALRSRVRRTGSRKTKPNFAQTRLVPESLGGPGKVFVPGGTPASALG
jgi:hypothetical protein